MHADRLAPLARALNGPTPRRGLWRLAAAVAAPGLASVLLEAGAAARRHKRPRGDYYKSIRGTFENKTGQPSKSDNLVLTINDKGKRNWDPLSDRSGMPRPTPSSFSGRVDQNRAERTDSTVAIFIAHTTPALFITFHNPDVFPLNVSISSGGSVNHDQVEQGYWTYDNGQSVVSDKLLLANDSFTQRVGDLNVAVSRDKNTNDYINVSVVLTKA